MIETTLVAWLTGRYNTLGADAGISVEESVMEDGVVRETREVARDFADAELDDEDEELDDDAADALLKGMGYSRINPWTRSGGQWAAEVEPVSEGV